MWESWRRGWRNLYCSVARVVLVVLILGLERGRLSNPDTGGRRRAPQARRLGAEVQTLIEVRAAGATGMGAGVDALPEERSSLGGGGRREVEP